MLKDWAPSMQPSSTASRHNQRPTRQIHHSRQGQHLTRIIAPATLAGVSMCQRVPSDWLSSASVGTSCLSRVLRRMFIGQVGVLLPLGALRCKPAIKKRSGAYWVCWRLSQMVSDQSPISLAAFSRQVLAETGVVSSRCPSGWRVSAGNDDRGRMGALQPPSDLWPVLEIWAPIRSVGSQEQLPY